MREWEAAAPLDELESSSNAGRSGSIAAVSANDSSAFHGGDTGHGSGGGGSVPDAVIDALVETVWAFPGLRVSLSRLTPSCHLRFLACAGPDDMAPITGRTLQLAAAAAYLSALRSCEAPIEVEDVRVDPRTKIIAEQLEGLGTRSFLALPLRNREPAPPGAVIFEAAHPRTWSPKEVAALERLEPLMSLALENTALRGKLGRSEASLGEYERRLGGVRGLVGGVVHDTTLLVRGLMETVARISEGARDEALARELAGGAGALGRQLEAVLSELVSLERGAARILEPLDLNAVLVDLVPGLRGLLGDKTRLLTRFCPELLTVPGHRTGLERTLLNLVVHASRQPPSQSVALETRREGDMAVVLVHGEGLVAGTSLRRLDAPRAVTPDELGLGLWLVRCEVLLHGGSLEIDTSPSGSAYIRLALPLDGARLA